MTALRWLTAGESHGPCLVGVLDGLPAGLPLTAARLLPRLRRRRASHGRGPRMARESDHPVIVAGVWKGVTTGAPLGLILENAARRPDWAQRRQTRPRAGHADLVGMLKYGFGEANPVIERASARETAMRTALGAAACLLLERFGARLVARVIELGGVAAPPLPARWTPARVERLRDASSVACCDRSASAAMAASIDAARRRGETLGGRLELIVFGLPPGIGAYAQWDRRLDARLGLALLSIPAVKEVEIGDALAVSRGSSREAHDLVVRRGRRLARASNRAGGLEGGVTNGEPLVLRMTLKPLPTQRRPLPTIELDTGRPSPGCRIRGDIAVAPAATAIAETAAGLVLADALLEKFGGDSIADVAAALAAYQRRLPRWPRLKRP